MRSGLEFWIKSTNDLVKEEDIIEYKENDIVMHPVFGEGKIVLMENNQYNIFFNELQKVKPISKSFDGLKWKE